MDIALLAKSRRAGGFSIIEVMTVIAILAILIGFGIPSYQEFIVNYRTSSQTNDLMADIAIARTEAVRYARTVRVEAAGGDWSAGWTVWVDLDGDGANDGGEETMRQQPGQTDQFEIIAGSGGVAAPVLAFGITGNLATPVNPVEFAICRPDDDDAKSRGVRVELNGRASSKKDISAWTVNC